MKNKLAAHVCVGWFLGCVDLTYHWDGQGLETGQQRKILDTRRKRDGAER